MRAPTDPLGHAYREHHRYVRGCLRRAGVPRDALDDAVHDVFTVLVRRRDDYDPRWSMRQFLAGIARNVAASHRRRLRRPDPASLAGWTVPAGGSPELGLELVRELGGLDASQREVVLACDRDGRSAAEHAAARGLPLTTVQWRLRCAHGRLRSVLARWREALASFVIDLRRMGTATVLHGGLGAALVITLALHRPDAAAEVATDEPVASTHGEPPAHRTGRSLASAEPPTHTPAELDGEVRLGIPHVEPPPIAAMPDGPVAASSEGRAAATSDGPAAARTTMRSRSRPIRARRRGASMADPIGLEGAIYYVMEDLHVERGRLRRAGS